MHEAKFARILAVRTFGMRHEDFEPGLMRRTEERNSLVVLDMSDQTHIDFDQPDGDQDEQDRHEAAAHQAVAELEVDAGDQHEGERDRNALVGHVGREHHPRHRHVDQEADAEQRHGKRMDSQQPVTHREDRRGAKDADDRESDEVGIDLDDVDQTVELAARLPPDAAGEIERRAGDQENGGRHEGEP